MSVAIYMDHHVPLAISTGLRHRDVDVLTAFEDGADRWSDEKLLERATELDRTVFTQDDDFLRLAHAWLNAGRGFGGVVYSHPLAITIGQAIRDLHLICSELDPGDLNNRIEFIPCS